MTDVNMRAVCDEFAGLWQTGQSPDAHQFLDRVDKSHRSDLLEKLLKIELAWRSSESSVPAMDEYHARFPDQLAVVAAVFAQFQKGEIAQKNERGRDQAALQTADIADISEETQVKGSDDPEETQVKGSDDPEETQVKGSDDPEETQVKSSDDPEETRIKSSDDSEETRVELAGAGEHGSPASAVTESHPAFADVSWRKREVTVGRVSKHPDAEYEIGNMLGQGGMGTVYRARQCSIDRMVALKVVKGNEQGTRARSGTNKKFLIEAVLTGALEHPNIVPIYDLGANTGGDLFYTMKEVRGAPWRKTIDEASVEDNLEVLVKVADAIGYAHSRGVVHRDLKPDNVMIGEFGEVIVMDWGLAIPTVEFEKSDISVRRGPAGTPGYMAPEMAVGPWDHIGPASDIYLLGALLFRLVTGRTLRTGKGSSSIMKAVSSNVIDWPEDSDTSQQELLTIARTALATEIGERFASVFEFQNALRGYRSHSESRRLTETALTELQQARLNDDYRTYERAGAGLEEALRLWPDNPLAGRSLVETRHSYAESAFRQGDLELAEGQLDDGEPQHVDLLGRIRAARDERDRQAGRIRRMKQVATGLAAAVFVTVSVSAVLINTARKHEATAKSEAVGRFRESLAAVAELSQLADALGDYPYAQQERQQLLEAVAAYYGRLTAEQSDVPELQYEQLQSLVRLGELSTQIAKYGRARQVFEQVGQQAKAMTAAGSTWGGQAAAACRQQLQIEMLRAQLGLASLNVQTGSSKNTMTDIELVITGLDALPDTDVVQRERADAWFEHGMAAKKQGEYAVAVNSFKQAVAVLAEYSTDDSLIRQATSRSMIGQVCEMTGDYEQAETSIAAAITLWKELEQKSGFKIDYLDGQATSRVDRANLLRVVGLDPLDDYSQAVECFTRLIEHRPGIPRYRNNHATALLGRAWRHLRMGDTGQGLQDAEESVNAFWSIVNRYPDNTQFALGEVAARNVLARILRDRGEMAQAGSQLDEALGILLDMNVDDFSQGHGLPVFHERYGELLLLSGQVSFTVGDREQAIVFFAEASKQLKTLSDLPSGLPRQKDKLAWVHYYQSRMHAAANETEKAVQHSLQAIQIRNALPDRALWLENRAWLLLYTPVQSHRDVETATDAALQAMQSAPENARFRRTAAIAQLRSGKVAEATRTLSLPTETRSDEHPEQLLLRSMLAARSHEIEQSLKLLDMARTQMELLAPEDPRLLLIRAEVERLVETSDAGKP